MRPRILLALGLFLFVSAVYIATGPGRIDIIDAQYRFEVARNILEDRSIQVHDPFLGYAVEGLLGTYSPYGLSGSLTGVPLIALAGAFPGSSQDRQQFLFSFTSGLFGAATIGVVFLFLIHLGVPDGRAFWWSLVTAFATLGFPVAASTFDQTQHGFFVVSACLLAFLSVRRDSLALAMASGAMLAFLVNFQYTYAILVPTVALAALAPPAAEASQRRRGVERALVVVFVGGIGVLLWMATNNFKFGSLLPAAATGSYHPPALGNPLIGLPGLLVSPGKSLFLYSPPTALAIAGLPRLLKLERRLGQAVVATSLAYFGMISSLSFYGGDWCWGPRYFASILPLLALGFPFVPLAKRATRLVAVLLIGSGLCVQALALSVDHHRFFYARSLPTFFWYTNPGYYFRHSALWARPSEVMESLRTGVPPEADTFRPGPYSGQLTYAVFGGWGHPELSAPAWMRHYKVFWLPRPWTLWMRSVPEDKRPIDMKMTEFILAAMAATGIGAIWFAGARRGLRPPS